MKKEGNAADYALNVTTHASLVGTLMLVTYVPGFAMWLPDLLLK